MLAAATHGHALTTKSFFPHVSQICWSWSTVLAGATEGTCTSAAARSTAGNHRRDRAWPRIARCTLQDEARLGQQRALPLRRAGDVQAEPRHGLASVWL